MAIDIDAVIEEGRNIISEVSAITNLAEETQRKVGGISDLTPGQIQDLKNEAVAHKAAYLTARTAFEAAFSA